MILLDDDLRPLWTEETWATPDIGINTEVTGPNFSPVLDVIS